MAAMKKFLIIGNANAITYKEVFPLIAGGEVFVRTAKGIVCFVMYFTKDNGEKALVPSVWYTNLDSRHLYKTLELTKTYDPAKYPRYDNYDAIEVSCIKDIPKDYDGVMGVPISIVLFSPEQFKILDARDYTIDGCEKYDRPYMDGKRMYCRALNQRSNEMNARPVINGKETYRRVLNENSAQQTPGEAFTYVNGKKKYARVFNEHSHPNPLAGGGAN